MTSWKLVVLGLTGGLAATIACSSSNSGGSGNCGTLTSCCPSADTSACTAIVNEGVDTTCADAVTLYCHNGSGSGTGGSTSSGSKGSSSSGGGGESGFACNVPSLHYCFLYTNLPAASVAAEKTACTSSLNGTVGTTCASANVVGCCTQVSTFSTEECYYSGNGSSYTAAIAMSACPSPGKFSAMP